MARCENSSIGQLPLCDMGQTEYLGHHGGLYGNGSNAMPAPHREMGEAIARNLAANVGLPGSGQHPITVAAIGFSFTNKVWDAVMALAPSDPDLNPRLHLVNLAVAGNDAAEIANPDHNYWTHDVPAALTAAGVAADEVDVVWILSGLAVQTEPFPQHVATLRDYWIGILQNVHRNLPGVRMAYATGSTYRGYMDDQTYTEPYYFEQGFAVRAAIRKQIDGATELNYDSARGPVLAPWVAWGDYLWTDGATPRQDGLTCICPDDLDNRGVHPSGAGARKLAQHLIDFWKADATAAPWWLRAT